MSEACGGNEWEVELEAERSKTKQAKFKSLILTNPRQLQRSRFKAIQNPSTPFFFPSTRFPFLFIPSRIFHI